MALILFWRLLPQPEAAVGAAKPKMQAMVDREEANLTELEPLGLEPQTKVMVAAREFITLTHSFFRPAAGAARVK